MKNKIVYLKKMKDVLFLISLSVILILYCSYCIAAVYNSDMGLKGTTIHLAAVGVSCLVIFCYFIANRFSTSQRGIYRLQGISPRI